MVTGTPLAERRAANRQAIEPVPTINIGGESFMGTVDFSLILVGNKTYKKHSLQHLLSF
jgi:hypothetical protein